MCASAEAWDMGDPPSDPGGDLSAWIVICITIAILVAKFAL